MTLIFILASLFTVGQCYNEVSCNDYNAEESDCYNNYCSTPTCQKLGSEQKTCAPDCSHPGCECRKGLLLDELSGECVPPMSCPTKEIDCSSRNIHVKPTLCYERCHLSCLRKDRNEVQPGSCRLMVPPDCKRRGCECKNGYYLNDFTGECVSNSTCNLIIDSIKTTMLDYRHHFNNLFSEK